MDAILIQDIVLRALIALNILLGAPILFCWLVFTVAWVRGELEPDSTVAGLIDGWIGGRPNKQRRNCVKCAADTRNYTESAKQHDERKQMR